MKRLLPALLLLAVLPAHGEIYKWVDEAGRTHFGEEVPAKYRKGAATVAPQPVNTIQGSALRGPAAAPRATSAEAPETAETPASPPATLPPSDAERCKAAQDRYRKSQECFARFRLANGALRAGAAQECEDIPQPPPCQ